MWRYTQDKWTDELLSAQFYRWWNDGDEESGTLLGVQAGRGPRSSSNWPRVRKAGPPLQSRKLSAAGSFGVANEGNVVSEEEVTEQQLKCFCVGMLSPKVIQIAVKTVTDVYSTIIVEVFYDLFKHHAEKDAEQSRCQNTILFHAVDDGEGSREATIQPNLVPLVFVLLDNHV